MVGALVGFLILSGFVAFVVGMVGLVYNNGKEIAISAVSFLLFLASLALLIFGSVKLEKQRFVREETPYVTHSIVALQDGNEIEGNFRHSRAYCMSGYIGEKFKYVYGYKVIGNGMKIQKVDESIATVYFDDEIEPCAKWYTETKKFWFFTAERKTCDIFVPTNALQAGITIDLQ